MKILWLITLLFPGLVLAEEKEIRFHCEINPMTVTIYDDNSALVEHREFDHSDNSMQYLKLNETREGTGACAYSRWWFIYNSIAFEAAELGCGPNGWNVPPDVTGQLRFGGKIEKVWNGYSMDGGLTLFCQNTNK